MDHLADLSNQQLAEVLAARQEDFMEDATGLIQITREVIKRLEKT